MPRDSYWSPQMKNSEWTYSFVCLHTHPCMWPTGHSLTPLVLCIHKRNFNAVAGNRVGRKHAEYCLSSHILKIPAIHQVIFIGYQVSNTSEEGGSWRCYCHQTQTIMCPTTTVFSDIFNGRIPVNDNKTMAKPRPRQQINERAIGDCVLAKIC